MIRLFYLPIIFLFLPAFTFWCAPLGIGLGYFYIVLYIGLILVLLANWKYCYKKILAIIKNTYFKYFVLLLILILCNSVLLSALKVTTIGQTLKSCLLQFVLSLIPFYFYFFLVIDKYISLKKFIKFYLLLYWIMLILGFIAYLGQLLDITVISSIFDFFANDRIMTNLHKGSMSQASNYTAFGLPRLDNLQCEPSWYARYLFLLMPIAYVFKDYKVKIIKNKFMDSIIKITLVPFTAMNVILTLSPIFLILFFVFNFLYYCDVIVRLLKKHFAIVVFAFILFCFVLSKMSMDVSESYLSRIINVFSINDFETFTAIEPSLATRVVNYINSMVVFIKYPFTGCGLGNLGYLMQGQLYNSPVPLTYENMKTLNIAIITHSKVVYNPALLYSFLAENGIFLFGIFLYYFYKMFRFCLKMLSFTDKNSFEHHLFKFLKYSLMNVFILFFYESSFVLLDFHFIFMLVIAAQYRVNMMYKRGICKNES